MNRWRGLAAWGIVLLSLGLLIGGTVYVAGKMMRPQTNVTIGGTVVRADIATTDAELEKGLGGVTELSRGQGMLFVFGSNGSHPMWMKDMNISLDIIWLDAGKRVVHIEHDLAPDTYPQAYASKTPSRYVLEVPAGTAAAGSTRIGTLASFDLK